MCLLNFAGKYFYSTAMENINTAILTINYFMADITTSSPAKSKHGVIRYSTRVDMTPMVDLGFLLITFFIFTAVVEKPSAMRLLLPKDGPDTNVPKSKTITVLSGNNNSIVCYEGFADESPDAHYFNINAANTGLRDFIFEKQKQMRDAGISPDSLIVIIKPGEESDYGQLMHVLDEMAICEIKRHAMAKQDEWDKELLSRKH